MSSLGVYMRFALSSCMCDIRKMWLYFAFQLLGYDAP